MAEGQSSQAPPDTPPAQGSLAPDPARVGEAAGEAAAQSGASRAETRSEVREAADASTGGKLTEAEKDEIADRTIDRLEKRGAFETPAAPEPPAAETPPAAAPAPAEAQAQAASGEGPPPRKRTFAERFVGRR